MVRSRQPNYPGSARSASIEGTTTVRILVGYEGEVESVVVAESSGNAALDAAAVDACYSWRFSGAKNGVGQKIRCYTYVPITFRLRPN
ncbi:MAG: TonB family protein [Phascolarctobacterium sp.]|nr:TonB family protein [Phascolarctobacterium sp.]